ncbi:MAG: VanW family protein, partial [Oscillospiraceae bacterium]
MKKLFCEISPFTYKISVAKCRLLRHLEDLRSHEKFAKTKSSELLPVLVYKNNSLIRRTLGNVDMTLQENKAVNLALAAPKIDKILIKKGEVFSFWQLVGECSAKKGFKDGLTIAKGAPSHDIGGGMCQFTNLIHWLVLHTDLEIVEHHHHDGMDLFPDFNRQIPFGTGTSILYNYLDYRFRNNTDTNYQLVVYTTDLYLCGEMRADREPENKYHIQAQNEFFSREGDTVYRNSEILRRTIGRKTGNCINEEIIKRNHAKV